MEAFSGSLISGAGGLVGVGNCASSFVQGLTYCRSARGNSPIPGLTQADIGGYRIGDIALSAAFDVNVAKVGRDVADVTFCFTPEHRGIAPHHTSPPQAQEEFAEFRAAMVRRYVHGIPDARPRRVAAAG